jgi:hypothetical protein
MIPQTKFMMPVGLIMITDNFEWNLDPPGGRLGGQASSCLYPIGWTSIAVAAAAGS